MLPSRSSEEGYTLTEILVVLLLMGLLASIAPPTLQRLVPRLALERQVSQIEAELSQMRRDAIRDAKVYELSVLPIDRRISVKVDGKILRSNDFNRNGKIMIFEPLGLSSSPIVFFATPDGMISGPTIRIENKGHSLILSASSLTGQVQVR